MLRERVPPRDPKIARNPACCRLARRVRSPPCPLGPGWSRSGGGRSCQRVNRRVRGVHADDETQRDPLRELRRDRKAVPVLVVTHFRLAGSRGAEGLIDAARSCFGHVAERVRLAGAQVGQASRFRVELLCPVGAGGLRRQGDRASRSCGPVGSQPHEARVRHARARPWRSPRGASGSGGCPARNPGAEIPTVSLPVTGPDHDAGHRRTAGPACSPPRAASDAREAS
jgi:hypothetical protein